MSKKEIITLTPENAPANKNSITFPRMVEMITTRNKQEEIDWFVGMCAKHADEQNKDYGVNVVDVRNEFINKFWPKAYTPRDKIVEKAKQDYERLKKLANNKPTNASK